MAKMVFDERYGLLTYALRAAIRKYNVSPSDYDHLVDVIGEEEFVLITQAIKDLAAQNEGYYNPRYSDIVSWMWSQAE